MFTLRAVGDLILDIEDPDWEDPRFSPVHALLAGADLSFANLEAPLTDQGIPLSKLDITRTNTAAADVMKRLGIQVVSLANNHIMDYGLVGLKSTIQSLEARGISYCGAGESEEAAFAPTFVEVNGSRVAFVSFFVFYFPGWDGYTDPIQAKECPGAALIRAFEVRLSEGAVVGPEEPFVKRLLEAIAAARREADHVVVSMHSHFGLECAEEVHPARRLLGHLAVEAGADLVLGHGPHATNGVEYYKGAFIAHSMGNFYFHYPMEALLYTFPESRLYAPRYLAQDAYWEGILLEAVFDGGRPTELLATPLSIEREQVPFQGMPLLGEDALVRKTARRLAAHSRGMGVEVTPDQGGRIRIRAELKS